MFGSLAGRFPVGAGGVLNKILADSSDDYNHRHGMSHTHTINRSDFEHRHVYGGLVNEMFGEYDGSPNKADSTTLNGANGESTRHTGYVAGNSHLHRFSGNTDPENYISYNPNPKTISQEETNTANASVLPPHFTVVFCEFVGLKQ